MYTNGHPETSLSRDVQPEAGRYFHCRRMSPTLARTVVPLAVSHMDFSATYLGLLVLCIALMPIVLLGIECRRLIKRMLSAEAKLALLSRDAGALNDDLLQSIQGFVLTVYATVQHVRFDRSAKKRLEKVFLAADKAVTEGRERFQQLDLRPSGKEPVERTAGSDGKSR